MDDLVSTGQELMEVYSPDDAQAMQGDVAAVTARYDDVRQAGRDKVLQITDLLRPALTDVSHTHSSHSSSQFLFHASFLGVPPPEKNSQFPLQTAAKLCAVNLFCPGQ